MDTHEIITDIDHGRHFDLVNDAVSMRRFTGYFLFVGALRDYKGIHFLLDAWKQLPGINLKIVGEILPKNRSMIKNHLGTNIEFVGKKSQTETLNYIRNAYCVIVPSLCYETFSLVIVEAYSCGVPVIASNIGALKERVINGRTGILFNPGDKNDLVRKLRLLIDNPDLVTAMGIEAYGQYKQLYNPDRNYEMLMEVYERAIKISKGGVMDVPINPLIYQQVDPAHIEEYIARGKRGIEEAKKGNRKIIDGVESLRPNGGYGGLGDFASYEYCMWQIEKKP